MWETSSKVGALGKVVVMRLAESLLTEGVKMVAEKQVQSYLHTYSRLLISSRSVRCT